MSILLIGNKCDLEYREITEYEARMFAKKYQLTYIETSSKDNTNVKEAFDGIMDLIYPNMIFEEIIFDNEEKRKSKSTISFSLVSRPQSMSLSRS